MIKYDLKVGEDLWIGDTRVTLKRKSGQFASLVIDAPASVSVRTPKSERKKEADAQNQQD